MLRVFAVEAAGDDAFERAAENRAAHRGEIGPGAKRTAIGYLQEIVQRSATDPVTRQRTRRADGLDVRWLQQSRVALRPPDGVDRRKRLGVDDLDAQGRPFHDQACADCVAEFLGIHIRHALAQENVARRGCARAPPDADAATRRLKPHDGAIPRTHESDDGGVIAGRGDVDESEHVAQR